MKIIISRKNRAFICLCIVFLFACFQNLVLVSFGGGAIKPYHLIIFVLFPIFFVRKKIALPPLTVCLWFGFVVFSSLLNGLDCGVSSFLIQYLFAFYALLVIINIGYNFTEEDWLGIVRVVAVIMSICVWIKLIVNYSAIIYFMQHTYIGHPLIDTFFGGGVNLEASYLAMMAPAFMNTNLKKYLAYNISCLLICVLYASRTAILLCLVCIAVYLFKTRKKRWLWFFVPIAILSLIYILSKVDLSFFLRRFTNIWSEAGVRGRLRMWIYAWEVFLDRMQGYGIGNSISAVAEYTGMYYSENNFHNLYIQMFIDLGLIGGAYYFIMVAYFFVKNKLQVINKPILLIMALYFFACLFEFRGAEIIIYFFFAAYFQQSNQKNVWR